MSHTIQEALDEGSCREGLCTPETCNCREYLKVKLRKLRKLNRSTRCTSTDQPGASCGLNVIKKHQGS